MEAMTNVMEYTAPSTIPSDPTPSDLHLIGTLRMYFMDSSLRMTNENMTPIDPQRTSANKEYKPLFPGGIKPWKRMELMD
jgi:hypothetical protein